MANTYYTLVTNLGKAKMANAQVTGEKVSFSKILLGSGKGNPQETQDALIDKKWDGAISNVSVDEDNPNWVVVEAVVPSNVGGFTINEIGLEDEDGDLIVIGNYPETYKPVNSEGTLKDIAIRVIIEVTNADNVTLKVDPSVVIATRKYVDQAIDRAVGDIDFTEFATKAELDGAVTDLENDLLSHKVATVYGEDGVHGLRVNGDGELQGLDPETGEWGDVDAGGGVKVTLKSISDLSAKAGNAEVSLNWTDPEDVVLEGATIASFKHTVLVRKQGSVPSGIDDGVAVVTSSVRNQYKDEPYVDDNVSNGNTYYYAAFAVSEQKVVSEEGANTVEAKPMPYVNYGVRIDTTNPDPSGAVTYIADAEGFSPLSVDGDNTNYGSWEDTFLIRDIKVANIKNGEINYELDRDDYSKKKDGGNADTTSGNDGDVMVGLPLAYWKFEKVGDNLDIYIADAQIDNDYIAGAHSRNGVVQDDYVWISAYKASESGSKLRSLSGKTTASSKTIGAFRTLAQANGSGYEQFLYYQMTLLQIMTLITTKSRDSQTALGMGYTNGNTNYAPTGTTDKKGLFYGESGGKQQMKAFGIEDFYGNKYDWVDGLVTDGSRNLLIGDADYNDSGSGYVKHSTDNTRNSNGYVSKVQGGTHTGFVGAEFSGSTTTHYADYGNVSASRAARFGGYQAEGVSGAIAGAFGVRLSHSASSSVADLGARCSFLKVD